MDIDMGLLNNVVACFIDQLDPEADVEYPPRRRWRGSEPK